MSKAIRALTALATVAAALLVASPAEAAPAPLIKSITPSFGPLAGGGKITIVGSYLTGATKVLFGRTPGTRIRVVSTHKITVRVPARASAARVGVRVKAHGRWSNTANYVYQPNAQVVTTGYTSCLTKADRSGWCWGENGFGQVGRGNTTSPVLRPYQLTGAWNSVTVKDSHTCGLRTNQVGYCWGLGTGKSPVRLYGFWKTLAPGGYTACGIKADDTLWCWGGNDQGQVGNGTTTWADDPQQVGGSTSRWRSVSNASRTVCGIKADSTGYCWGDDMFGAIGNTEANIDATTPFALGAGWTSLTTTGFTTCGVQAGVGRCWGTNTAGQVGNGAPGDPPYPLVETPTEVAGAHAWARFGASSQGITCGVDTAAAGWCFGEGGTGALGAGTGLGAISSSTPLSVGAGAWVSIQPGASSTCGLRKDRTLWCWGENDAGTVGDGTTVDRYTPTRLSGRWTSFSIGGSTVCAVRTNNSVWCWGQNRFPGPPVYVTGAVGNGGTGNQLTPYHLPGT